MDILGALLAAGVILMLIAGVGAMLAFAWALATLEAHGPRRARGPFAVLVSLLLVLVASVTLIGATA